MNNQDEKLKICECGGCSRGSFCPECGKPLEDALFKQVSDEQPNEFLETEPENVQQEPEEASVETEEGEPAPEEIDESLDLPVETADPLLQEEQADPGDDIPESKPMNDWSEITSGGSDTSGVYDPVREPDLVKRKCECGNICTNAFCTMCGRSMSGSAVYEEAPENTGTIETPDITSPEENTLFLCSGCGKINLTRHCVNCGASIEKTIEVSRDEYTDFENRVHREPVHQMPKKSANIRINGLFLSGAVIYLISITAAFVMLFNPLFGTLSRYINHFIYVAGDEWTHWDEVLPVFLESIIFYSLFISFFFVYIAVMIRYLASLSANSYSKRIRRNHKPYGAPSIIFTILTVIFCYAIYFFPINDVTFIEPALHAIFMGFKQYDPIMLYFPIALMASLVGGIFMMAGFNESRIEFEHIPGSQR